MGCCWSPLAIGDLQRFPVGMLTLKKKKRERRRRLVKLTLRLQHKGTGVSMVSLRDCHKVSRSIYPQFRNSNHTQRRWWPASYVPSHLPLKSFSKLYCWSSFFAACPFLTDKPLTDYSNGFFWQAGRDTPGIWLQLKIKIKGSSKWQEVSRDEGSQGSSPWQKYSQQQGVK